MRHYLTQIKMSNGVHCWDTKCAKTHKYIHYNQWDVQSNINRDTRIKSILLLAWSPNKRLDMCQELLMCNWQHQQLTPTLTTPACASRRACARARATLGATQCRTPTDTDSSTAVHGASISLRYKLALCTAPAQTNTSPRNQRPPSEPKVTNGTLYEVYLTAARIIRTMAIVSTTLKIKKKARRHSHKYRFNHQTYGRRPGRRHISAT